MDNWLEHVYDYFKGYEKVYTHLYIHFQLYSSGVRQKLKYLITEKRNHKKKRRNLNNNYIIQRCDKYKPDKLLEIQSRIEY